MLRRSAIIAFSALLVTACIGQTPRREQPIRQAVRGANGAVAAGSDYATEAGMRLFAQGGNAVDVGVATMYAASVTELSHFGLGGEAPILIRTKDGKVHSIAGVGTMPKMATADFFRKRPLKIGETTFEDLIKAKKFDEIAAAATRIESRTNLLFSFEKMALRDGLRTEEALRTFSEGLYEFLHGRASIETRFNRWCAIVASLPRRQTRVLTWPVVTVFGFIAQPDQHIFVKPNVMRIAAAQYGFNLHYHALPNWSTYGEVLEFAAVVRWDLRDLAPHDMLDIQSFLWVQGSEEYRGRTFRAAHTTRIR